jgi:hypothetical protein
MCGRVEWDYVDVQQSVAESGLPQRVWLAHCAKMGERTWDEYHRCAMGDAKQHWLFGDDAQMAADLCALYQCGLLIVDARGTRQHTPHLYSDDELALDFEADSPIPPLRAYVRAYVPSQLLQTVTEVLPSDVLWFKQSDIDVYGFAAQTESVLRTNAKGDSYLHHVAWPYMAERTAVRTRWEREAYGLNRLPGLCHTELVEFIDVDEERADGYLFTALAHHCRRVLQAHDDQK